MKTNIRQAAVAGMFYPDDPRELQETIEKFLLDAQSSHKQNTINLPPKALIVPHAGYIYSGPVAASAYADLEKISGTIKRVVLIGPGHRFAFTGLATSSADYFITPLGTIPIDKEAIQRLEILPQVQILDQAHSQEHSLEVQLPFLQQVLSNFTLIPMVVGDASPDEVAEVLEFLWGGPETLIIVSSDLSHYHEYETAQKMDLNTSRAIETLSPGDIHYDDACGRNPVNGLLVTAANHGLHASTIDLRNSGDTAGPKDRVVGYGAYVFT